MAARSWSCRPLLGHSRRRDRAALRIHREHWLTLEERAESAIATREIEATRRVTEERLRIARDLHDVIGHQVAMLSMHLGAAEIGLPEDAEPSRQALVSARSSARTVVVETQRILALLRLGDDIPDDEALRPTPALSGLEGLVASFESIGLDVRPSIDLPAGFVEPSVGVTVYRVVQEALTNAYRHGEGPATVDVRERDGRICVTVENRVGHTMRGSGSGLGLLGMRERVESSSGRLTIDSDDGRFRVHAEFSPWEPLSDDANPDRRRPGRDQGRHQGDAPARPESCRHGRSLRRTPGRPLPP